MGNNLCSICRALNAEHIPNIVKKCANLIPDEGSLLSDARSASASSRSCPTCSSTSGRTRATSPTSAGTPAARRPSASCPTCRATRGASSIRRLLLIDSELCYTTVCITTQFINRCHQTDKPYKCNSCYKCFVDEASLLEHIPKHKESKHLKTHICQYCGKSYTQVNCLTLSGCEKT